jgi:phosphatidylinositol dimannoside acyltransferase
MTPATPSAAAPDQRPNTAGGTMPGGLRDTALVLGAKLIARLPEAPLVAAAEAAGELWYRLAPGRAAQARANLARVCEGLAASGRGTALARRAATDPDALERMVRAAFRHAARYYLEVARADGFTLETALERIDIETPAELQEALASGRPIVLVGMHFGAIELPVVIVSHLVGHAVTAPMETVTDAGLQRWFVQSRSRVGVHIVPITDARRTLLRALRRGESVGVVADRDLTRNGLMVPLFGHPAPISAGPALLAVETGVPVYVGSARRTRDRRYLGRLLLVPAPEAGSRRERVTALTAGIASAFESLLADAPEQWWGAFHPIWPDLVPGLPAETATADGSAPTGRDYPARPEAGS